MNAIPPNTPLPAHRPLGDTGLTVGPIGWGAFKIGRNTGTKYPREYPLPRDGEVRALLDALPRMGINLIDTAPAYGTSEERLGQYFNAHPGARDRFVIGSKVGETFTGGHSTFDFSPDAVTASAERSLQRLHTDRLDLLLIHSDGNDRDILERSGCVDALVRLKRRGLTRCIGMSGKTVDGAEQSLAWADVIMVEYHQQDTSHDGVMHEAGRRGVGVLIKKALASGTLEPTAAVRFAASHPAAGAVVIGSLNPAHLRANVAALQ